MISSPLLLLTLSCQTPPTDTDRPLSERGSFEVISAPLSLIADGRSSGALTIAAFDRDGVPVADGTVLPLSVSSGWVRRVQPSVDGLVAATYVAGTYPQEVELFAPNWSQPEPHTWSTVPGAAVSAQLHLHGSLSEGSGTMRGHTASAAAQGLDLLWWTDHDFLYYPNHFLELTGFNFDECRLGKELSAWPSTRTVSAGWEQVESGLATLIAEPREDAAYKGACGLRLSGTSHARPDIQSGTYAVVVKPDINLKSLLADVSLRFAFRPRQASDAVGMEVTVWLSSASSSGTTGQTRAIRFGYGAVPAQRAANPDIVGVSLPGRPGEWTAVDYDLSAIAAEHFPDLAGDLHAELVRLSVYSARGETAAFDIDELEWSQEVVGAPLQDRQRALLKTLDDTPMHLVGQEISLLGAPHLNAFGSGVPFVPYWAGDHWTGSLISAFVREHGGMTACAHMFGVSKDLAEEPWRSQLVADTLDAYLAEDAYGCELLEVGYRQRVGDVWDFLSVWDRLTGAGLYLTGIGASDVHNDIDWDSQINNFVTWIQTASSHEEDLLWGLRRGAVWFGDPSIFPDGVSVELLAPEVLASMGQVVVDHPSPTPLTFTITPLPADASVVLVDAGKPLREWSSVHGGRLSGTHTVEPSSGSIYRLEVYDSDGRPILFSNPITFVDAAAGALVPGIRRVQP